MDFMIFNIIITDHLESVDYVQLFMLAVHPKSEVQPLSTSLGEMFSCDCIIRLCEMQREACDADRWHQLVRSEYMKRSLSDQQSVLLIQDKRLQLGHSHSLHSLPDKSSPQLLRPDSRLQSGNLLSRDSRTSWIATANQTQANTKRHWQGLGSGSGESTDDATSVTSVMKKQCMDFCIDTSSTTSTTSASSSSNPACSARSLLVSTQLVEAQPAQPSQPSLSLHKQAMWTNCRKNLDTCHRDFLIQLIHKQDEKAYQLKQVIKDLRRKNIRLVAQNTRLQTKLKDNDSTAVDLDDDRALDVTRLGTVRLSVRGIIALGLRKSLALTSAVGFPLAALINVSRWTVVKAEIHCWAGFVCKARAFNIICGNTLKETCKWIESNHDASASAASSSVPLSRTAQTGTSTSKSLTTDSLYQVVLHDSCQEQQDQQRGDQSSLSMVFGGQQEALAQALSFPAVVSYDDMCGGMSQHRMSDVFCIGGTEFAGDASNSSIWQNSKLSGLIATRLLLTSAKKMQSVDCFHAAFNWYRSVCLAHTKTVNLLVGCGLWVC